MTSPAPTVTGPRPSTSRGRPVIALTPSPVPIPPSRSLRGTMPGSLVARLAGGHFKEARRVPFGDQALGRWKMHGTLAPFSIASVVGATEKIRSCCAASVRDPALDGERHGGATSLGAPAARRFCITAAGSGMPSLNRCPMFCSNTPARPGPAADFASEAKPTRCPYITNISGSARKLQGSPAEEGHAMLWLFVWSSGADRCRDGGYFEPDSDHPPPGRLDDELHDEGCSIVPLRSPDPTSIMGPPGPHSPVSGPRIRNPEDSWRLACPGHSKRCRQKLRLTAHHQAKQHIKTMPIPLPRDPTRDSAGFSKRTTPSALFVYQG